MADVILVEYKAGYAQLQADQKVIQSELKATEKVAVDSSAKAAHAAEEASTRSVNAKKKESEAVKVLKAQLLEIEDAQKKLNKEAANTAPGIQRQKLNKLIAETAFEYKAVQKELEKTRQSEEALNPPVIKLTTQIRKLKDELARATDPKEVIRLAQEVGKLSDQIEDAADAGKVFASDSKFEQVGNALGDIGGKLRNLDFKGAADQSRLLVSVVQSFSVKDAIQGVKDLGTTFLNLGKALLFNPLFLIPAALAAIGVAAFTVGKQLYQFNIQTITVTESLAAGRKAIQEYADRFAEAQIKIKESLGIVTKSQADALRANINYNKEIRAKNAEHSEEILKLAKELDIDLRALDANGNAVRRTKGGLSKALEIKDQEKFNNEKAKIDARFQREISQLLADQNQERLSAQITDNVERGRVAREFNEKIAAENLDRQKKENDDLIKEQLRLQQVLRDLRTANIKSDYEREKQIILNNYADRLAEDGKSAALRVEIEIKKNRELEELWRTRERKNLQILKESQVDYIKQFKDGAKEIEGADVTLSGKLIENQKAITEATAKESKQQTAIRTAVINSISSSLSQLSQITANINENQLRDEEEKSAKDRKRVEADFKNGIITKQEYEDQVADINAKAKQKENELKLQQFENNKSIAIVQAIINTAQGVSGALAQTGELGYAAFVLAALIAAGGALQIATIQSQSAPKFEKGGKVKGKLHKQGGEIIEAEKDEWIINRKDSIKHDRLLDAVNKGNAFRYIKEIYIAPALKAQQRKFNEEKERSFAGAMVASLSETGKFYDGNLLDSLKQSRISDKNNTLLLIRELKTKGSNSHSRIR